jgi:hypothetical protein
VALWLPRPARAGDPGKLVKVARGARGTTLTFSLASAPFPCPGEPWTDPTVLVYVPHHYRLLDDRRVDTIVHFHGHRDTADEAMVRHQLREQLLDSRQNAILVIPQGPVRANNSSGGKLERPQGLLTFLSELRRSLQLAEVGAELGEAGIPGDARIGAVALSAHSGGYRVAGRCAEVGGFDVTEIYLFDALYGDVPRFRDWLLARRDRGHPRERHKLVSYYRPGKTQQGNDALMAELTRESLRFAHETEEGQLSRAEITKARAVFVRTDIDHDRLMYRYNALRDCLFASCFKRRLNTDWFDAKTGKRDLDPRD